MAIFKLSIFGKSPGTLSVIAQYPAISDMGNPATAGWMIVIISLTSSWVRLEKKVGLSHLKRSVPWSGMSRMSE